MKRKLLIGLIALGFTALAVWLDPTRVVWSWLRGEAFYQGRPTSYWSIEISRWKPAIDDGSASTIRFRYDRESPLPRWLARYLPAASPEWPSLLDGDPDAIPVLLQLLNDPSPAVRDWAHVGINRISSGHRGPYLYLFEFPDLE